MAKTMSWGELSTYKYDKNKYYEEYVLGIKEPPNEKMIFGSIIHKMLEDKTFDYKNELIKNNFTADFIRIAETINKTTIPNFEQKEVWLGVKDVLYDEVDCKLCGKADGIDTKNNLILEIKTGNFWTQEKTDEHGQLTLYSFLYWKQYKVIPECLLISFNSANGKCKQFLTKRTNEQIDDMCQEIKQMVSDLKSLGWWDKRISSYQK